MATNTTDPEILGWVQEPDGRGSFGILKSCVITLVLCMYTALHLNIPPGELDKDFPCLEKDNGFSSESLHRK
ncbi:hypothetical protein V8F06_010963 [Rhypophila decipiens]